MNEVMTVLGYLSLFLVCLIVLAYAVCIASGYVERLIINVTKDTVRGARRDLGSDLVRYSYWFSESPETMKLMLTLGQHIILDENGLFKVEHVRDEWRNKVEGKTNE